jgi:hypothetical protein
MTPRHHGQLPRFDVVSFANSRRQLRREAAERRIKVSRHLATTTDTIAPAVYRPEQA